MKDGDIIVIDSVRKLLDDKQQTVIGRIITDKAGNETKIKKGQGGKLEDRWGWLDENAGKAIKLTVRDFMPPKSDKAYPYVADFEVVEDVFVAQAAESLQAQAKDTREDRIERQVAIKEIGEDWRVGKLKDEDPLVVGYLLWLIDRLNYEEAKGETTKDNKGDKETQAEPADRQDSRETTESDAKRVEGFLNELKKHGKKDPRLWLDVEYGISQDEKLTPKKCEILYKAIVKKEKW